MASVGRTCKVDLASCNWSIHESRAFWLLQPDEGFAHCMAMAGLSQLDMECKVWCSKEVLRTHRQHCRYALAGQA